MAFSINTNVAALNAHKAMTSNDMKLSNSLNRLSTGLRINSELFKKRASMPLVKRV